MSTPLCAGALEGAAALLPPRRLVLLLGCLWWVIAPCLAQSLDEQRAAVVRIVSKADGASRTGTGFVVSVDKNAAYIVTASHVIEGDSKPQVEFFTQQHTLVPSDVLKLEGGDPKGLAVLAVRGSAQKLAPGIRALKLGTGQGIQAGSKVVAIGFPQGAGPWAIVDASVASLDGRDLAISGNIDEGNSGGPVLVGGQVVGVMTGTQGKFGRATPVAILQIVLQGWGINVATEPAPPTGPASSALRVASVEALRVLPSEHQGRCPIQINFFWRIAVEGSGTVSYQLLRSDGVEGPIESVNFDASGAKEIRNFWRLGRADASRDFNESVMLRVLAPNKMESARQTFNAKCVAEQTPALNSAMVRIVKASCAASSDGKFRILISGEASAPEGAILTPYPAVGARTERVVTTCQGWSDTGARCKREHGQPEKINWSSVTIVGPSSNRPTRSRVELRSERTAIAEHETPLTCR